MSPDDAAEVEEANARFYRAFESLEISQMEQVWARGENVRCIHPGWCLLSGWGAVRQSWEAIFKDSREMRFSIGDVDVHAEGDLAWVTCTEHLETHGYDGVSHGAVEATNVFERHEGRWYVVHHHGSPLVRSPESGSEQLQ